MAPKKSQQSKACGRRGGVAVRQSARGRNNIMEFPFGGNSESIDSERESERENANNETFAAEPSDGEKENFKTPGNGEDKENKKATGGQLSENANESESVPAGNESRSTRESSVGENPARCGELKDEGVIGDPQFRALSEGVARLKSELRKLSKGLEEKDLSEQLLAGADQKIEAMQEEIENCLGCGRM